MYTININDELGNLLNKENINAENALKEYVTLDLLNKKDKYFSQIKAFESKYQAKYNVIEKQTHRNKNEEDFQKEEDLMEWEFAINSLKEIDNYLEKLNQQT